MRMHAVRVDVANDSVRWVTTARAAEDYRPNETETIRSTTVAFLRENELQLAINANFYAPFNAQTIVSPGPSNLAGLAVADGVVVSPVQEGYAAFCVFRDGTTDILDTIRQTKQLNRIETAVAGRPVLLREGTIPQTLANDKSVHPRTAVGISKDRRFVYLLVIDGRQKDYSEGARCTDLARCFLQFDVSEALNLDGGGSTTLVCRGDDGKPQVLNRPVGARLPNTLRHNGNAIGIRTRSP